MADVGGDRIKIPGYGQAVPGETYKRTETGTKDGWKCWITWVMGQWVNRLTHLIPPVRDDPARAATVERVLGLLAIVHDNAWAPVREFRLNGLYNTILLNADLHAALHQEGEWLPCLERTTCLALSSTMQSDNDNWKLVFKTWCKDGRQGEPPRRVLTATERVNPLVLSLYVNMRRESCANAGFLPLPYADYQQSLEGHHVVAEMIWWRPEGYLEADHGEQAASAASGRGMERGRVGSETREMSESESESGSSRGWDTDVDESDPRKLLQRLVVFDDSQGPRLNEDDFNRYHDRLERGEDSDDDIVDGDFDADPGMEAHREEAEVAWEAEQSERQREESNDATEVNE
ncbi:hypothetical protein MNV49_006108 [Pseudohyphozyma bogoriensis]|nr:hypothetical protein MNV49_006108 [Pseudohyphozyma bogoriensis]